MYYIYCYTNKINQHKYVGQTNNFKRRVKEHSFCAFNATSSSYNALLHQKMREYGEENFEISLLETLYTDDQREVDDREQYWIAKLETFRGTGKGYNSDHGGCNRGYSSKLSQEAIQEIKNKIKNKVPYVDIEEEYGISATFISNINWGIFFSESGETYPLCRYYKEDSDYDELIDLLLNSTYPMSDIAKMLGIGYSTVKKINSGAMRHGLYPSYPIRKKTPFALRADQIKHLLLTTDLCYDDIIKAAGSSRETIRRINVGETFYDPSLTYPLRTCNDYSE